MSITIVEIVRNYMSKRYPDAKELYGDKYDEIITSIANQIQMRAVVVNDIVVETVVCDTIDLFSEVRAEFYDEKDNSVCIDGWFTDSDYEEGIVIAQVYRDHVKFVHPEYENDISILRAIQEANEIFEN